MLMYLMIITCVIKALLGFQKFRLTVPDSHNIYNCTVTLDLERSNISDFVHFFTTSDSGSVTFLVESFLFWISQAYLILLMRSKIREIKFMECNNYSVNWNG